MRTAIGLFRGINVGGRHVLPMKDLAGLLEEIGLTEVRTYIQSGNVVFRTEGGDLSWLASSIAERLLGVPATARNWRTVSKLLEMIE